MWSGLFPAEGGDYSELREALDRLKLNDAALVYEPETSPASSFETGVASGAKTPASSASESIALAMNRTFEREGSTPSFTRR